MGSASSQLCAWVDVEEISHSTLNMLPMQAAPRSPALKPSAPTVDKLPSLSIAASTASEFSTSDSLSSSGSAQSSHKTHADPLAPVPMRRAISLEAVQMKDSSCSGDCAIQRVSARLHTLLLDHNSPARSDLIAFPEFEPSVRQIFTLTRRGDLPSSSRNHLEQPVPSAQQIAAFITELAKKSQLEKGCVVVALVYIDRLIHSARLRLTALNWRHVAFAAILMASKVWDDVSMWSVDFASVSQFFTLQQANAMELLILKLLDWNVTVSPSEYSATFLSLFDSAADLAAAGVSLSDITVTSEELPPSPAPLSEPEVSVSSASSLPEAPESPLALSFSSGVSSLADEIIHSMQPMPLSVA